MSRPFVRAQACITRQQRQDGLVWRHANQGATGVEQRERGRAWLSKLQNSGPNAH